MEVHVSINTNGSPKELQRLTDRLGDLANLLEAITEAELSRSSNSYFAAASRADDGREKAELIALVKQLTPKEVDRVIERMQALLNGKQDEQEVAE